MKNALLAVLKFVLFAAAFFFGSFLDVVPSLKIERVIAVTAQGTRVFAMDGLLLALALCIVLLLIEAARKRIRTSGPWTAAAFVLAVLLGFARQWGMLTR